MAKTKRQFSPEALLIASLVVSGCATPPPEEYKLSPYTSQASYFHDVQKAAAYMSACATLNGLALRESDSPSNPYNQMQRQLKAVYHYFVWQDPERRRDLLTMLHGQMQVPGCQNLPEMKMIVSGLEQIAAQADLRDAAINEKYGSPTVQRER